jgi:hypothetical protein
MKDISLRFIVSINKTDVKKNTNKNKFHSSTSTNVIEKFHFKVFSHHVGALILLKDPEIIYRNVCSFISNFR